MKPKAVIRLAVDLGMTALLPVMTAYNLTENTIHEVLGVSLFTLFVLHHVLNLRWYKTAFAGKQDLPRLLHTTVNILLFLAMIGLALSAVLTSKLVFSFLGLKGDLETRKLHVCLATWTYILLALHLGFHWNPVTGFLMRTMKSLDERTRKLLLRLAAAATAAYGIYASFAHDIGAKLIMYYGFSFWDPERNPAFFFAEELAILGLYACAAHYAMKALQISRNITAGFLLVAGLLIIGCAKGNSVVPKSPGNGTSALREGGRNMMNGPGMGKGPFSHISTEDSVFDLAHHPAFAGFGRYLLPTDAVPTDKDLRLNRVGSLLPYHGHVDPSTTVQAVNRLIDDVNGGKAVFYDFYTETQKREDSAKEATGLFFFQGKAGAPFAVVCPGGGFSYVGSLHEGFPYALEISRKGYNAFVLRYRLGSELRATEDLDAALSYIFEHAEALEVGTEDYSLWGSSAGARMVANVAAKDSSGKGGRELPKPSVVVMAYTGHPGFSKNNPPTFVMVSADDGIVNVEVVEKRVAAMRSAGLEVEYRKYANAGHGFGLGIGTDAEGWIGHAIRFWEDHRSR